MVESLRGQAAVEFLFSYGWSILVVLGVLSAVVALDPLGYGTTATGVARCQMGDAISCDEDRMTADIGNETVQFSLQNRGAEPITIEEISFPEMSAKMDTGTPTQHNLTDLFPEDYWFFHNASDVYRWGFRGMEKHNGWFYFEMRNGVDCNHPDYPYLWTDQVWRVKPDFSEAERVKSIGCGNQRNGDIAHHEGRWYWLDNQAVEVYNESWEKIKTINLNPTYTEESKRALTFEDNKAYIIDDGEKNLDVYNFTGSDLTFQEELNVPTTKPGNIYIYEDKLYIGECSHCLDKSSRDTYVISKNGTHSDTISLDNRSVDPAAPTFFSSTGQWYFSWGDWESGYGFVSYPAPHCVAGQVVQPGESLEFDCNVAGAKLGDLTEGNTYRWPVEVEYYSTRTGSSFPQSEEGTIRIET